MQKSTDPNIRLGGNSRHMYKQLCLVTYLVSSYFRYVKCIEDLEGRNTVEIAEFGPEKLGIWSEFFINTKVKISKRPFRWY